MAKSSGDKRVQAGGNGMVLIRIFLGVYFLYEGIMHLLNRSAFAEGLSSVTGTSATSLQNGGLSSASSFMLAANAHADFMAMLFILGGIVIGLLLLLGLLTRLGAVLALCFSLFLSLTAFPFTGAYPQLMLYIALMVMELATLISGAGRSCGVDVLLARKSKLPLLW